MMRNLSSHFPVNKKPVYFLGKSDDRTSSKNVSQKHDLMRKYRV